VIEEIKRRDFSFPLLIHSIHVIVMMTSKH